MVKVVKTKTLSASVSKKASRAKVSATASLKKEFKAKTLELKKKFDKHVKDIKKAAAAKAVAAVTDMMTKHEQVKSKAVKEVLGTIEKARALKVKTDKAANRKK